MDTPLLPPRYRLVRSLGEGGTGRVLLADDLELGRRVAVKMLAPLDRDQEDEWARRLVEEARVLSRLRHDHIVSLYDMGELASGRPYLVFEFVEGIDMARLLEQEGPLSIERAAALLAPVLDALAHAHDQGVVHRDVKPANILIRAGTGQPLLADFGCARTARSSFRTQAGIVFGTPGFVAPEVLEGHPAQPASDLYAVGCVLFEALTGRTPFEGGSAAELLIAHLRAPVPPTGLPPAIDAVVRRALAKRPEERAADARAMAVELQRAVAPALEQQRRASQATVTMVAPKRRARRRHRTAPAVALAALAVALAAWFATRAPDHRPLHPALEVTARGHLRVSWSTARAERQRLVALEPGTSAGRAVADESAVTEHALELADLAPGTSYELAIEDAAGQSAWQSALRVPSPDELELVAEEDAGAPATRVRVAARAEATGAVVLVRPDGTSCEPTVRTSWETAFVVPVARTLLEPGWEVRRLCEDRVKMVLPVPSGRDEVAALVRSLLELPVAPLCERLTRPPAYCSSLGTPQWPHAEGAQYKTQQYERRIDQRRLCTNAADGTYPRTVRDALDRERAGHRALALRNAFPAFFGSPAVPLDEKLALYRALAPLEWLDRLALAQLEAAPLGVRDWYRPLVTLDFAISAGRAAPPRAPGELLAGPRGFLMPDGAMWETETLLFANDPAWKNWFGAAASLAAPQLFAQARAPLELDPFADAAGARAAGLERRTGIATLAARVAMLSPATTLSVEVLGKDGRTALEVPLEHAGTLAWQQNMEDLTVDGLYVGALDEKDAPAGHVLWGEVRARFDARLLPGRYRLRVAYRRAPGTDCARMGLLDRFASLGSLALTITD